MTCVLQHTKMVVVFLVLIMNEKPVLVVEGTSDVNKLTNIIDADFVICNGSAVSNETISYIKELVKTRIVVVLTDPDFPGMQIRNKIAKEVKGVYHAYVDRKKASNGKKLGVAECDVEEIKRAIANYVCYVETDLHQLSMQDMVELKLTGDASSSQNRELISKHFHTGYSNAKTLLKHLNMLGVKKEELIEVLKNDCE